MAGSTIAFFSDNVKYLNYIANDIYTKPNLNKDEIEALRKIIMICNVLYNRTDATVLPIEDGFYDLLLEKYKVYDQHFQVGSAIVQFKESLETDTNTPMPVYVNPIRFVDIPKPKNEIHGVIRDQLKRLEPIRPEDFIISPISFTEQPISKRQHNTEHNHPDLVGTLDKTKFIFNQEAIDAGVFDDANVKILERDFFGDHIKKGIIHPNQRIAVVCELKYDGISVEADCDFTVQSARTRGDTGIGEAADITPMLRGYTFKRAGIMIGEKPIGVKFEAIMTNSNLQRFNQLRGNTYCNCRTAIVGLFGASDAYLYRDLITLIPLAIDRKDVPSISNRMEEIQLLNTLFVSDGEPLRYQYFEGTVSEVLYMIKAFSDEAFILRDYMNFMYDGIVVSYVDEDIRQRLGRSNFINKYSVAVKFTPRSKTTTFRGYTYTIGQNGSITPMIHYDTVEFIGTLHNKSTGSSLKRFKDLALKEGDLIQVTYVNDVMPYVTKLDCEHNRNNPNPVVEIIDRCPICGTKLIESDSGKTLLCPNLSCDGRAVSRTTNMFQKMNIKGFAEAAIRVLNLKHLYEIKDMTEEWLVQKLGEADGRAFYQVIASLLNDEWYDYIIMGALGFSSIARKKWKSILEVYTIEELYNLCANQNENQLYTILRNELGDSTSLTIAREFPFFMKDIEFILSSMHIINTKGNTNQPHSNIQIRFSGCRNLQLVEQLSIKGIDIDDSGVTKNTSILLVPYEGFSSTKVSKAMKYCTRIIPIQSFIDNQDEIIRSLDNLN